MSAEFTAGRCTDPTSVTGRAILFSDARPATSSEQSINRGGDEAPQTDQKSAPNSHPISPRALGFCASLVAPPGVAAPALADAGVQTAPQMVQNASTQTISGDEPPPAKRVVSIGVQTCGKTHASTQTVSTNTDGSVTDSISVKEAPPGQGQSEITSPEQYFDCDEPPLELNVFDLDFCPLEKPGYDCLKVT